MLGEVDFDAVWLDDFEEAVREEIGAFWLGFIANDELLAGFLVVEGWFGLEDFTALWLGLEDFITLWLGLEDFKALLLELAEVLIAFTGSLVVVVVVVVRLLRVVISSVVSSVVVASVVVVVVINFLKSNPESWQQQKIPSLLRTCCKLNPFLQEWKQLPP